MDISEIVKLECCDNDFSAKNKNDVLHNLTTLLKRDAKLQNFDDTTIFDALKEREEMGSTGFTNGIAIPHCQLENLDSFIIALAVCKRGVNFDALDKKKSRIFVTIVGPKNDRKTHLKLLAKISQILKDEEIIEELIHSKTKIGLFETFLRNIKIENKIYAEKGKDVLMLLTVKDEDIMQDITEIFVEYGIHNSTIINSNNMENLLSTVPLFMGFFNFTGEKNIITKTILVKLNKTKLNALLKGFEDRFGDLDNYSALSLIVLDIFFSKGV
ncbi:MAG: PTS sugar transporter subunit IIA [Candidatus Cloacimonetes bacterium]|jgi:nitrogen PTS system EIIA component|nr:PTS sugar transporter subunit IIA [Candidatus Cloacimonadota bacterium]